MARATATYDIRAEDKTSATINKIKGKLGGLGGAFRGLGGQVAAVAGIGGFGAFIKATIDTADEIQKLSIQGLGTTEFLSEMQHVAGLNGVAFTTFTKSLQNMTKQISIAGIEGKGMADEFEELGLNLEEMITLSPEAQFERMTAALHKLGPGVRQTQIAMEVFGGRGVELLRIINGGTEAMAAQREEAKALGVSLSRDQVDAAAAANDAMLRLQNAFKGVGNAMVIDFAEPMAKMADFLRDILVPTLGFAIDWIQLLGKAFGGVAAGAVAFFSGNFSESADIFKLTFSDLFSGVGDSFDKRFGAKANQPSASPLATTKDPEQEKTREVINKGNEALKEIAKNTKVTRFAIAG